MILAVAFMLLCFFWVVRFLSIAWSIDAIRNGYEAMNRPVQKSRNTEFDSVAWTGRLHLTTTHDTQNTLTIR